MNSKELFASALDYEKRIRDLYLSAVDTIDDSRGKAIFKALADDEASHVAFLEQHLEKLETGGNRDASSLVSSIPSRENIEGNIQALKAKIPDTMLGDVKRVLSSALAMEVETSAFYKDARDRSEGVVKELFQAFLDIENRHADMVQFELDMVSGSGYWFNFMEIDMED